MGIVVVQGFRVGLGKRDERDLWSMGVAIAVEIKLSRNKNIVRGGNKSSNNGLISCKESMQ